MLENSVAAGPDFRSTHLTPLVEVVMVPNWTQICHVCWLPTRYPHRNKKAIIVRADYIQN